MAIGTIKKDENSNTFRTIDANARHKIRVKATSGYGGAILIGLFQQWGASAIIVLVHSSQILDIKSIYTGQTITTTVVTATYDSTNDEIVISTSGFKGSIMGSGSVRLSSE